MKIIMIHPHDVFSPREPWTIRIKEIARYLKNQRHEITLVTFTLDGFKTEPFIQDGITYICLSRKISLKYFFAKIRIFLNLFKDKDIIYFQKCFHYSAVPVIIAGLLRNKHIHYDWDDNETAIFFSGKRVPSYLIGLGMYVIENLLPSIADSISVSSNELLKIAEKKIKNKKYLIKVPVGASHYSITQDSVELIKKKYNLTGINQIYIGQLHGGQYAELLIRACLKLKTSGIQTKTLIVGDGYDKPRLENIVKELNLENEVIFTGAVLHEHIPAYLKACDIAIACFEKNNITASKSPLKIAEYISAGKAIIAHHIGEVSDMVNDAAILISPDDKDSLYNAILSLHKEPQKIKELENKACLRYKELTWDKSAEKINTLFSNLSS